MGADKAKRGNFIDLSTAVDYVGLLADGITLKRNIVVLRHSDQLDSRLLRKRGAKQNAKFASDKLIHIDDQRGTETIDVWITHSWDNASVDASTTLMLQLAYVLYSNKEWKRRTKIRLIKVCATSDPAIMQRERLRLAYTAEKLRVLDYVAEMLVVCCNASSILAETPSQLLQPTTTTEFFENMKSVVELNQTLQRQTTRTAQIILMLPDPRTCLDQGDGGDGATGPADGGAAIDAQAYLAKLALLTDNLPSTMLVFNEDDKAVVSTSI